MRINWGAAAICIGVFFLVTATAYGDDAAMPDEIKMEADYEHEKGIVVFSHGAHAGDYFEKYPDLYRSKCGECHHDAEGQPLNDLKPGDAVDMCIDCHDKPGRPSRDTKKKWREDGLSRSERNQKELEYHAEALHGNCIGCHRAYKKATKSRSAPTSCTKCHPKTK